jgi:hypothetical protein
MAETWRLAKKHVRFAVKWGYVQFFRVKREMEAGFIAEMERKVREIDSFC